MLLHRFSTALCALALAATLATADYEYRYLEGETYNRAEMEGLRDEGFTSWMRHPSGGKVVVFGRPEGGWVEYDVKELGEGPYYLYVRCLALPQTKTSALWDAHDLGLITHDGGASTSLRWSKPLGPLPGGGDHALRLRGAADSTQWPYIDALLLTTQEGYVPADDDQDFVSYTTAWPLLTITGAEAGPGVAPVAGEDAPGSPLAIEKVSLRSPVLGPNPVTVTVRNTGPKAEVTVSAALEAPGATAEAATATVTIDEGAVASLEVRPTAKRAGSAALALSARSGAGGAPTAKYALTVPPPVTVALDEYAYPSTVTTGQWKAVFACAPELLPRMSLEYTLRQVEPEKTLLTSTLKAAAEVKVALAVGKLPIGRYEVAARLRLDQEVAWEDQREFIRYPATPLPAWEPIREAKSVTDRLVVNGKPFLGLLVYHSGATPEVRARGFNLVQCWGEDPDDPLPQIRQHLDACQKEGIYGTVALFHTYFRKGQGFDLAHLQRTAETLKDHPALLAWDLIDEPDAAGLPPEMVKEGADVLRQIDPNHPVWINLCQYPKATDYLDSQDLWSFDTYPLPTLTPAAYRVWLNISDEKLVGHKPLGTCLQTYVYDRHMQRMPTPDELRTSAWLHAIHGYTWFGYYSYYDGEPAGCLMRDPVLWSYVRALNTELLSCREAILGSGDWRPLRTDPAHPDVEAREKKVGNKRYVVIVNLTREPVTVTVKPDMVKFRYRLLFEADAPAEAGTDITASLRPTATRVYEVTP